MSGREKRTPWPVLATSRWLLLLACCASVTVGLGATLVWAQSGSPSALRVARGALRVLPVDPRPGHPLGQWAALVQGRTGGAAASEFAPLIQGPWTRGLMRSIATEPAASVPARIVALQVLAENGEGPEAALLPLLYGGPTPPRQRQELAIELMQGPDGARWADLLRDVPLHDLSEAGTLALAALGEPGCSIAAARDLRRAAVHRAGPTGAWALLALDLPAEALLAPTRDAGLSPAESVALRHHPCTAGTGLVGCTEALATMLRVAGLAAGEQDAPPQPPLITADEVVDILFAGDGESADVFREEVHRLAAWAALAGEDRGEARVRHALIHPQADVADAGAAWEEAGRPHAAFARGGAMPGATAVALAAVAAESGVALRLWTSEAGVLVELGDARVRLEPCLPPMTFRDLPDTARFIPEGGAMALALLEAMGRSLRAGDWTAARAQAEAADALWPGAPGLRQARSIAAALSPPPVLEPPPDDRPPSSWRSARQKRGRPAAANQVPPAATPPPTQAAPSPAPPEIAPEDRVIAAWWAALAGDRARAQALLETAAVTGSTLDETLRPILTARLLDPASAAPQIEHFLRGRAAQCPAFLDWGPGPAPSTP